ncbi:MAG: SDR family oxidoreductase [Thermodesulfovibrionales bacterium]|nr:SDR family oxidoreductase [Thermodesulfovibrionales bacterium]
MNTKSLVCLITGGTGGLGKYLTSKFLEKGHKVIITYRDKSTYLDLEDFQTTESFYPIKVDIKYEEEIQEIAQRISKKFFKLDVIINNAAITVDSLILKIKEDDWDEIIKTNLTSPFKIIKNLSPLMKEGGHIINISSYSGIKGKEGQSAYSASKAGLIGLTKSAAFEFARYGIKVNAIVPGYLPIGMGLKANKAMFKAKEDSLLNTLSDPEEVANFILYLINTKNITGQIFTLESRIVF